MSDFTSFFNQQKQYEKALAEVNAANKITLFDALIKAGVTTVTVEFDGEGDSGQIESVTACIGDKQTKLPNVPITVRHVSWNSQDTTTVDTPLPEAIKDLCYDYLSQEHGGWENNDGAFGTFSFDVAAKTIALEFNGRFTDTFTSNHNF